MIHESEQHFQTAAFDTFSDRRPQSNTLNHETITLRYLKERLPSDYYVFHSVHWTRDHYKSTMFGELDFVIIGPREVVLIIEQKNGSLHEMDGGLYKDYASGSKDVVQQIHRSLNNVREKYKSIHGAKDRLNIDYLLYCPDYNIKNLNSVGIDASHIVDASNSRQIEKQIVELMSQYPKQSHGWMDRVMAFFKQSFSIVPDIHSHIHFQEKEFIRLSSGLHQVIQNLQMGPFRLRVQGAAGSGKSLAARWCYERYLQQGKRPLLVCFNRPLMERFRVSAPKGGMINTWHGLCDHFVKCRGHSLDYSQAGVDPHFWKKVGEIVISEPIEEDWLFDALIVDEGQDFSQEWVDILSLFLKPGSDLIWFEDSYQNLQVTPHINIAECIGYQTNINFRSPFSIVKFLEKSMPFPIENANMLPGLGVGVTFVDQDHAEADELEKVISRLIKSGFSPEDIVVLTFKGINHSVITQIDKISGISTKRFTGKYDASGNQVFTKGRLYLETIYRFKGQQAPAIVIVEMEHNQQMQEKWMRLFYCGATRATIRLELIIPRNHSHAKCITDSA
ncbi:MAG: ATP-binding domain-containing protein [Magnetococcales bacterium]|nr:ATP-binding domain-containing protein [Magnetococcales bacterium]